MSVCVTSAALIAMDCRTIPVLLVLFFATDEATESFASYILYIFIYYRNTFIRDEIPSSSFFLIFLLKLCI